MRLHTYLPQDRLHALARRENLPDRASGSVLFADISGFTPLTETLSNTLGVRRGAEEVTKHLDAVYTELVSEVENYGGSVLGFAGDAITCWFDDTAGPAAPRAAACAFALQAAMQAFRSITVPNGMTMSLTLKVAIATGPARRFVVGDPAIHFMDALAGETVARTSTGEHLANKGDILFDAATVDVLGRALLVKEWRSDPDSNERFAVVIEFNGKVQTVPTSAPLRPLDQALIKNWMHDIVYQREISGQSSFLTEFRPCAVLFVRFLGIDYEAEDAQVHLDSFVRRMQEITARYEGAVLQLIIGDKGSYAYLNFGALVAHEDDVRRAVKVALELRTQTTFLLQMGITQGVMRTGSYGSPTRRTYSALGDEVNLAARLMQAATPGEILLSGHAHKLAEADFVFEPRPPLTIKGKTEPLPVFAVTGERQQRAIRLQEPLYALPMVGRQAELQTIEEKLNRALGGLSQVIGIVAEAGMGKSRLVAEAIRLAHRKGFVGYGGACLSDAVNTPYQAWKTIWNAFFDVDPSAQLRKQIRSLEGEIEDRAPQRMEAIPLLGKLLGLDIPENNFTQALEPKIRQSALHALLEDCLKAAAHDEPLLIVIEDVHWIDALSHDLLDQLARAAAASRVCFVLAYRPPQIQRLLSPRLEALPQFTKIELSELNAVEAEQAIRAKLAQMYPARGGAVPPELVQKLTERAQGNPFYLEELLNFLRDRGLDPRDPADLEKIELPDSLHALILSRIDRLSEHEKTTLRVASVIGRLFHAAWLPGYYPDLGGLPQVVTDLNELHTLDITPLDSPAPELRYLFKHIVTHQVTYESLPFATRSQLHEQLAVYLEGAGAPINVIAQHYGLSDNLTKQRAYFQEAAEAAQAAFANDAALEYYARLLPLVTPSERIEFLLKRGDLYTLIGEWTQAESNYQAALAQAESLTDLIAAVRVQLAMGILFRLRGDNAVALSWLGKAHTGYEALGDARGRAKVLIELGIVNWRKGTYTHAREYLEEGLALARALGDSSIIALALANLGVVALNQGDYAAAQALSEESLVLQREMGDQWGIAHSLNNLGSVALDQGNPALARALYGESLVLQREMGNKPGIAGVLNNLGTVALNQGDYAAARALSEESLMLRREMGDQWGIANSLNNLGNVAFIQADFSAARMLYEESLALWREMDDQQGIANSLNNLGTVAYGQGDHPAAQELFKASLVLCVEIGDKLGIAYLEAGLAEVSAALGLFKRAAHLAAAAEALLAAINALLDAAERGRLDKTIASVRSALDDAVFQSAWEDGQRMTMEEAVAYALETGQHE